MHGWYSFFLYLGPSFTTFEHLIFCLWRSHLWNCLSNKIPGGIWVQVHLIEGIIDQVEGTVHVSWVQPRVLGIPQIKSLRDRLDNWLGKVHTALLSIEAETPDLVASWVLFCSVSYFVFLPIVTFSWGKKKGGKKTRAAGKETHLIRLGTWANFVCCCFFIFPAFYWIIFMKGAASCTPLWSSQILYGGMPTRTWWWWIKIKKTSVFITLLAWLLKYVFGIFSQIVKQLCDPLFLFIYAEQTFNLFFFFSSLHVETFFLFYCHMIIYRHYLHSLMCNFTLCTTCCF